MQYRLGRCKAAWLKNLEKLLLGLHCIWTCTGKTTCPTWIAPEFAQALVGILAAISSDFKGDLDTISEKCLDRFWATVGQISVKVLAISGQDLDRNLAWILTKIWYRS